MIVSRDQNSGRCHNIKTDNRSFKRVEELKYLGTILTNQNYIQNILRADSSKECLLSFVAESFGVQFPT